VGTNAAGSLALPNKNFGVRVSGSFSVLGDASEGNANIISGNGLGGVYLSGTGNVFRGNLVGTSPAGSFTMANGGDGIANVGSNTLIDWNIFAGNDRFGVYVQGEGVTVKNNFIGTNVLGTSAIPNGNTGAYVLSPGCIFRDNVVSGNRLSGVYVASPRVVLTGNVIGLNFYGNASIPNGFNGLELGSSDITVGGVLPGEGNLISSNTNHGISASYSGTAIFGNWIGTDITGTKDLPNKASGIFVSGSNVQVGGLESGQNNTIVGGLSNGVTVSGSNVLIRGNLIEKSLLGVQMDGRNGLIEQNVIRSNTIFGIFFVSLDFERRVVNNSVY
jgi:hypothetical protein